VKSLSAVERSVIVRACKYDGREHKRWSAELVKQEGSLLVLDAYFPEEISHDLLGTIACGTHSLEYYWLDRWYNVFRFAQPTGELRNYYCNINLPPTFVDGILSYVDLDLDILVGPDYSYQVLDAEDFETNARLYSYSDDTQTRARLAVEELIKLIEERKFPFNQ
jgi:protein associated with RNAse G/E